MRVVSLASGSSGNAYCVVAGNGRVLLVDCGISFRELCRRASSAGVDLSSVEAVVFTHDHDDHVKGVKTFAKRMPGVPLFANTMTAEAIAWRTGVAEDAFACFENGQAFSAGPFEIKAFPVPHDVPDCVGYLVRVDGSTYFHATDVGSPLDSIGVNFSEADVATLESNYDPELLALCDRPECLKQRIRGPRGHLSNDESAALAARFASARLKKLHLAHLSAQCNAPHLAERAAREALDAAGRGDVALCVLPRDAIAELP